MVNEEKSYYPVIFKIGLQVVGSLPMLIYWHKSAHGSEYMELGLNSSVKPSTVRLHRTLASKIVLFLG